MFYKWNCRQHVIFEDRLFHATKPWRLHPDPSISGAFLFYSTVWICHTLTRSNPWRDSGPIPIFSSDKWSCYQRSHAHLKFAQCVTCQFYLNKPGRKRKKNTRKVWQNSCGPLEMDFFLWAVQYIWLCSSGQWLQSSFNLIIAYAFQSWSFT